LGQALKPANPFIGIQQLVGRRKAQKPKAKAGGLKAALQARGGVKIQTADPPAAPAAHLDVAAPQPQQDPEVLWKLQQAAAKLVNIEKQLPPVREEGEVEGSIQGSPRGTPPQGSPVRKASQDDRCDGGSACDSHCGVEEIKHQASRVCPGEKEEAAPSVELVGRATDAGFAVDDDAKVATFVTASPEEPEQMAADPGSAPDGDMKRAWLPAATGSVGDAAVVTTREVAEAPTVEHSSVDPPGMTSPVTELVAPAAEPAPVTPEPTAPEPMVPEPPTSEPVAAEVEPDAVAVVPSGDTSGGVSSVDDSPLKVSLCAGAAELLTNASTPEAGESAPKSLAKSPGKLPTLGKDAWWMRGKDSQNVTEKVSERQSRRSLTGASAQRQDFEEREEAPPRTSTLTGKLFAPVSAPLPQPTGHLVAVTAAPRQASPERKQEEAARAVAAEREAREARLRDLCNVFGGAGKKSYTSAGPPLAKGRLSKIEAQAALQRLLHAGASVDFSEVRRLRKLCDEVA
jgi:hypothetical protein